MNSETIGIIDLGSNSTRMVLYAIHQNGAYQPIFEMKRRIRLAEYLDQDNCLQPKGLAKAVYSTKLFTKAGEMYGVTHWIAVATAAIRQSSNQAEIVQELKKETGLNFRVLQGHEEGYLGYLGVINTLDVDEALLFDIGGASTELMLVTDRRIQHVQSIPYGALNLTSQFSRLPNHRQGEEIYSFIRERLMHIPWLPKLQNVSLVGLGGAARALGKLDRIQKNQPKQRLHGYELPSDRLATIYRQIISSSAKDLLKMKGISKRRADVLVASFAAIQAIATLTTAQTIIISRSGLREGLMYEYMFRGQSQPIVPSVLEHSLANFHKLYNVNPTMSGLVRDAALALFDSLVKLHGLGARERKLLRVTAQIETCGLYINTEKWTRHSAYLTLSSHLHGLQGSEYQFIADLLCAKKDPIIQRLSLLLRIARFAVLEAEIEAENLTCAVTKDHVRIGGATGSANLSSDSTDADLAKDFETVFNRKLVFVEDAQ